MARGLVALPDRAAHALVLRDLDAWIRIQALGTLARTGIAAALVDGGTLDEIAARCDVADRELLAAVLRLGESVGEVRRARRTLRDPRPPASGDRRPVRRPRRRGRGGRHLRPRIYRALGDHLRGAPPPTTSTASVT